MAVTGVSKEELEGSPEAQKVLTKELKETVIKATPEADDVEVTIESITDSAASTASTSTSTKRKSENKKHTTAGDVSIKFIVIVTYAEANPDTEAILTTTATAINTRIQSGNMTTVLATSGITVLAAATVPATQSVAVVVVEISGPGTELEPTSTPTSIDNSTSSGGTVRLVAIIVAALLIVLMIVVIVYFNIQPDPLPVDRKVYPGGYQGNGNGDTYGNFDDFRPAVKRKPSADIDEVDGGAPRVTGFNADGSISEIPNSPYSAEILSEKANQVMVGDATNVDLESRGSYRGSAPVAQSFRVELEGEDEDEVDAPLDRGVIASYKNGNV